MHPDESKGEDKNQESIQSSINRLFAYCKGGNFNIHIWAWFDYFIF